MIKDIFVTNLRKSDPLELHLSDVSEHGIFIEKIDGLGPKEAAINITDLANTSGGIYTGGHISYRNLVFYFILVNDTKPIEDVRNVLYGYFPVNTEVGIEIKTDTKRVRITGIVEKNDPDIFQERVKQQVSILCPFPFYERILEDDEGHSLDIVYEQQSIDISEGNHSMVVDYKGSVENGFVSMLYFKENIDTTELHTLVLTNGSGTWDDIGNNVYVNLDIVNQLLSTECQDYKNPDGTLTRTEGLGYKDDYIIIDTESKELKYYDSINLNLFSILGALDVSSISGWPMLVPGYNMDENTVTILPSPQTMDEALASNGNIEVVDLNADFSISWKTLYQGV